MPKNPRLKRRNRTIYSEFLQLKKKRFETKFVLEVLADKYFLEPDYIFKIIRLEKHEQPEGEKHKVMQR